MKKIVRIGLVRLLAVLYQTPMRKPGTAAELQSRRERAVEMLASGCAVDEVAAALDVSRRSVNRWRKAVREHGKSALDARPHAGRDCFLTRSQQADLRTRIAAGPQQQGFRARRWTSSRVQKLIEVHYGVSYHTDHIPRLLRSLGIDALRTRRRATVENESLQEWLAKDWQQIKSQASSQSVA